MESQTARGGIFGPSLPTLTLFAGIGGPLHDLLACFPPMHACIHACMLGRPHPCMVPACFPLELLNPKPQPPVAPPQAFGYLSAPHTYISRKEEADKVVVFERGDLVFVFNFHPTNSYTDYRVGCMKPGKYKVRARPRSGEGGRGRGRKACGNGMGLGTMHTSGAGQKRVAFSSRSHRTAQHSSCCLLLRRIADSGSTLFMGHGQWIVRLPGCNRCVGARMRARRWCCPAMRRCLAATAT